MKLSDYVMEKVADAGVKHVFVLPGGGAMHLNDSLGTCKRLEYICNLHEQPAAIAADAYGQYTNNLGVCLVTTGPGSTNALTGVTAAWLDSTPVLVISGQVKRADRAEGKGIRQMGFQEIDIVPVVSSITKYAVTITEPGSIRYHLEKAMWLARNGRPGPAWVDIPLDVQAMDIDVDGLAGFEPDETVADARELEEKVAEVVGLLNGAERPVLLVGNGVRHAHAIDEFLELADMLGVPVLTTWKTADFFDQDHPLFVGRPGIVGQRGANFTQQNADLFISIGARLDIGQVGFDHSLFARAAKKVVVDIDTNEINKMNCTVDVPVCSDAKAFIDECLRQRGNIEATDRGVWLERCKAWQSRYPVVLREYWEQPDAVHNYVLVDVLADELSTDDLLIPGSSGACCEVTLQAFRVKKGQRIFYTPGLGAMGLGISASIGGCVASGHRRTICVDGDGGFYMNVQELEVVKRLDLPIKYFVLNNQGYASIRATQNNYFEGRLMASDASSGLTLPDAEGVASAFGLTFHRLESHEDIHSKVRAILDEKGPSITEVSMRFEHTTAPKVSSYQKEDGSMASRPFEDMAPFLDRDEFHGNMLVPVIDDSR